MNLALLSSSISRLSHRPKYLAKCSPQDLLPNPIRRWWLLEKDIQNQIHHISLSDRPQDELLGILRKLQGSPWSRDSTAAGIQSFPVEADRASDSREPGIFIISIYLIGYHSRTLMVMAESPKLSIKDSNVLMVLWPVWYKWDRLGMQPVIFAECRNVFHLALDNHRCRVLPGNGFWHIRTKLKHVELAGCCLIGWLKGTKSRPQLCMSSTFRRWTKRRWRDSFLIASPGPGM